MKTQNTQLTQEKQQVTAERDSVKKIYDSANQVIKQKEDVIDVGSTLHASNFNIVGIKEKSGGKEKITTTAKRVDKLRISFDIDENRITQSGSKDIYVAITSPDGNPVVVEALVPVNLLHAMALKSRLPKKYKLIMCRAKNNLLLLSGHKTAVFKPGIIK